MSNLSWLAGNALVVLGMALALSAFSYAHWEAREQGLGLRVALRAWPCQISFDAAALLVSAGLLISSRSLWERIVWGTFMCLYLVVDARQLLHRRGNVSS